MAASWRHARRLSVFATSVRNARRLRPVRTFNDRNDFNDFNDWAARSASDRRLNKPKTPDPLPESEAWNAPSRVSADTSLAMIG